MPLVLPVQPRVTERFRRAAAIAGTLAVLAALPGCRQPYYVWIRPGSTAARIAFGLGSEPGGGRPAGLLYLVLTTCAEAAQAPAARLAPERLRGVVWYAQAADHGYPDTVSGRYNYVSTVTFPVPPPNFVAHGSSGPLSPGCYVVQADAWSGDAEASFTVAADGSITPNA